MQKYILFSSITLATLLASACTPPKVEITEAKDSCRERARKSGNPNELFYCPEDFEGPLDPPPAGKGIQLHYGPKEQTAAEEEMCLTVQGTGGDRHMLITQYIGRMRPGSHHFLLYRTETDLPDGVYYPCFAGYPNGGVDSVPEFVEAGITSKDFTTGSLTWLAGLQAPGNLSTPNYEDRGIAMRVTGDAQLVLNVHYINVTDEPVIQEVWVNAMFAEDPANIKEDMEFISLIGAPLAIPPKSTDHEQRFLSLMPNYEMDEWEVANGKQLDDLKVHLLTAHAHRRLTNFEIIVERADGTQERVYNTDSWYEPEYTFFDPPLLLGRNDKLRYICTYTNDEDREVNFGETVEDEMCNVFGIYSPGLGGNWINGSILK